MDFSIIICTYNPDELLLKRCLSAVTNLNGGGFTAEVILVDNNSKEPLIDVNYVQDFIKNTPDSKLLLVKEQGLSHARIAGIQESEGRWVVFFDDDNEPDAAYLTALDELCEKYPNVVAWGPGNVFVDFVGGIRNDLEVFAREAFQERFESNVTYSNQRTWQSCYPFGTGLCIQKSYLNAYMALVAQGQFTLSGRKGKQLTSGEDTQMVLFCVSKGVAAGVSHEMKMTHIIPEKRATLDYLKRLTYGTGVCYSTVMLEVFPEYIKVLEKHWVKEATFVTRTLKKYLLLLLFFRPKKALKLISYIAEVSGIYIALGRPVPPAVNWVLKRLAAN